MSVDFAFIDSGIGGIPYLAHLKKQCPQAECIYFADNKNFPYGTKTHDQIVECVTNLARFIIKEHQPKAVVIACNTISVNALEDLRKTFPDTPFVGTVPAIKLAATITRNKVIGLLATESTVNNPYISQLKEKFAADCRLVLRGDSQLISFIEKQGFLADFQACCDACKPAVDFFKAEGCDTVILGCTHFLNFSDIIARTAGQGITVIDSRDGVVRRALNVHKVEDADVNPPVRLYATGSGYRQEYEEVCRNYKKNYGLEIINEVPDDCSL